MSFYPAQQIIPGLWIGSSADSRNRRFMEENGIGLVVNATKTIPFSFRDRLGYRIPVDDHPDENTTMLEYFPISSRIIDETLKSGIGVLVHCYAGIQRSCAVVAAYLIYKYKLTARQAINEIKHRKHEAFEPDATFRQALTEYAKSM